jgi:hypothetical protein
MNITLNSKYTVFGLSEMLPASFRSEVVCKGFIGDRPYFSQRGKRKKFHMNFRPTAIVVEGWDIMPQLESEVRVNGTLSFVMDGTYRFMTEIPAEIESLLAKNLNPDFNAYDSIKFGTKENMKPFIRQSVLENAVRPTPQKLTTGEQNLLKEYLLDKLKQDAPRTITERNRFGNGSVLVNELESGIYNASIRIYEQYDREASKGTKITAKVDKADRLKYLLAKLSHEAYMTLLD